MGQLREVLLSKPNYSNFDLSRTNHFSAAVGPIYPVAVEEVLPGDTHTIRLIGDVKTYPLLSPLLGSFKQQVCCFFIPTRLYTQAMDQNKLMFEPKSILFPFFNLPQYSSTTAWSDVLKSRVRPSTILDCLGVYAGSSEGTSGQPTSLNATPLIGYYDIFRNYFCNTQESAFYIGSYSAANDIPVWITKNLSSLDVFIQQFVSSPGVNFETAWRASGLGSGVGDSPLGWSTKANLAGLLLRTHNPDMLNAWLSNGTYSSMVSGSSISTSGNQFTIQSS
jgi:hypothetical protein